jgi:Fic family protein
MSEVLDQARGLIQGQLDELNKERAQLERALVSLNGSGPTRRVGRPKGSGKKQRRRRKGTRLEQAVALVNKSPGITAGEIAKSMKIKPNYLYRVMGTLEKEGSVKKDGRRYHPA